MSYQNNKDKKCIIKYYFFFKVFIIIIFIKFYFDYLKNEKKSFYFDKYQTEIYLEIRDKLIKSQCSIMHDFQRKFLNGIIR